MILNNGGGIKMTDEEMQARLDAMQKELDKLGPLPEIITESPFPTRGERMQREHIDRLNEQISRQRTDIAELESVRGELLDALEQALKWWDECFEWACADSPEYVQLGEGAGEYDAAYRNACDLLRREREGGTE